LNIGQFEHGQCLLDECFCALAGDSWVGFLETKLGRELDSLTNTELWLLFIELKLHQSSA
jgi:hypothetical protein